MRTTTPTSMLRQRSNRNKKQSKEDEMRSTLPLLVIASVSEAILAFVAGNDGLS
jgi:hypothetical protein